MSCNNRFCSNTSTVIKQLNTNNGYRLKGTYCIEKIAVSEILENKSQLAFNLYARIEGKKLNDGVIRLYSQTDTIKINYSEAMSRTKIPAGIYIIEAWEVGFNTMRTKKIEIRPRSEYTFNFYLGTEVQY
jgi:hypothetical protein